MPDEDEDASTDDASNSNAALLPVGLTFLAVGVVFLFGPSASLAWAFIPIGITFVVIAMSGREPKNPQRADKNGDGSVPPASDTDSGADGGGGGGD